MSWICAPKLKGGMADVHCGALLVNSTGECWNGFNESNVADFHSGASLITGNVCRLLRPSG